MLRTLRLLTLPVLALAITACVFVQERYPTLPPGPYRAVLELEYQPVVPNPKGIPTLENQKLEFDEVTEGLLPFNMEVIYENDTTFRIDIINGDEVLTVLPRNIRAGWDQRAGRDTLRIDFPVYDTHISAYYEENVVEGVYVVHYRENYRIPFKAYFGKNHRFTNMRKEPAADLSGNWAVVFEGEKNEDPYPGIAEFTQKGNDIRGTFRTETGDYRFLEGTVQKDKLYLSVFDGAHAFLFEAKINADGTLNGTFRSGRHYITNWTAQKDENAVLRSPDGLTTMREDTPLSFTFPTADGKQVSLDDAKYQGKPKLIKIMGTWCPNCREEADFLKEYLAGNDTKDLEVIALAFEQYGADDDRSREVIRKYEQEMNVPWPVLLAGSSDKEKAGAALPMLSKVISYPTLLFVDRENNVRRIYTGFNGAATSSWETFQQEFDASVKELIQ